MPEVSRLGARGLELFLQWLWIGLHASMRQWD